MTFSLRLSVLALVILLCLGSVSNAQENAAAPVAAVSGAQGQSSQQTEKSSGLRWDPEELSAAIRPLSYAFVSGDEEKYRQMEWRNDGALWGTPEYSLIEGNKDDVYFELTGHDLMGNNDYGNEVLLSKKGLGFVEFNFDQYRKYFDGHGGVMPGFSALHVQDIERDLYLDIGKVEVAAGLRMDNLPEVTFKYEHEYKSGSKSRLTWASVVEGVTRKISPSWQEVDEDVNVFEIEVEHQVLNTDLKLEQRFEDISIKSRRYEQLQSVNATASEHMVRVQDQEPDSYYSGTGLRAERWDFGEKLHSSAGYHLQYVKTTEWENMKDYTANMGAACFTANCENKIGAYSSTQTDMQDFVWHTNYFPLKDLSAGLKLKAGVDQRHAHSDYPGDVTTTASDGVVDRIDKSYTTDQGHRLAQGLSVRYTGIKHTALYTDLSLEQKRSWLSEDRQSVGVQTALPGTLAESFERETIWNPRTENWTAGINYSPDFRFTVIPQIRLNHSTQDYDDKRESAGTTALSAFTDKMKYSTAEFSTRVNYRPAGWLHTGFKYMVQDSDYASRYQNELYQESSMLNNSYSFDVYVYPMEKLNFNSILTLYDSAVRTPVSNRTSSLGTFKSDVATWFFGVDYLPFKDLTVKQNLFYSFANNYEDYSVTGLPYGAAFDRVGYSIKFDWTRFKKLKIGPIYSFSAYTPNVDYDASRYKAHLIGLDLTYSWD